MVYCNIDNWIDTVVPRVTKVHILHLHLRMYSNLICIVSSTNTLSSVHSPPLTLKEALYRIWCGVNRLGDSGVKVV